MAEQSEGKKPMNLPKVWMLLEECIGGNDEARWTLTTGSNSNLNKCGFELLDIQEEILAVSKFLNKSANTSG